LRYWAQGVAQGQIAAQVWSLKSGERRRQSSSANLVTCSRLNVSVNKPDCIGL
jgi:hypothetical protein